MALIAYTRVRIGWGGIDFQHGSGSPYSTAQTLTGGSSAAPGEGVGVRRVVITVDRSVAHGGADPAQLHFDFMNMTAGAPDDTWTTSDYTTLEGFLDTWINAVKSYWPAGFRVTQYAWYREGPGVVKPNPAERLFVKTTPIAGTGASFSMPPQVACSITFRTALRKHWGRVYLPIHATTVPPNGVISSSQVDGLAGATDALVTSAAGSDFYLVVTSKTLNAALNVEHIEVDDVLDVVRRRRWKVSTYKKIIP